MKVAELAKLLDGTLEGDGSVELRGVAALENASPGDLTYAEGERQLAHAAASRAGCILVPEGVRLVGRTTVAVKHPKLAFARVAEALVPTARPAAEIHPTAVVSPGASLGEDVNIGPWAVVEAGVKVGSRTVLGAGVVVGRGAEIGEDCILHARVVLYPGAKLGRRVVVHAGAVIGSDGFGYVFAEGRHHKFPQLGGVVIEDDVEIGSNTTVDRGSLGTTVIGAGTKIDNLVQVAHNVRIGRHCVIAAQTGISGSVEIGDYVVLAGQVGVADHVKIEERAVVGAQAGIPTGKTIRKGTTVWGTPARPLEEFKKMYAHLSHLPELARKVKEMSRGRGSGGA